MVSRKTQLCFNLKFFLNHKKLIFKSKNLILRFKKT